MVKAIAAAQEEAEGSIAAGKGGHSAAFYWMLTLLPADTLAVITLNTCMRAAVFAEGADIGMAVAPAARSIAGSIRMQVEFNRWSGDHPDVLERLQNRLRKQGKTINKRYWTKWRERLAVTVNEEWPEAQVIVLGSHLLALAAQAAPEWLELKTRTLPGGRTQRAIVPTQATIDLVSDVNARAEVAQPVLRPMLCRPIPWKYEET